MIPIIEIVAFLQQKVMDIKKFAEKPGNSSKQQLLNELDWPFQNQLDAENRWVNLSSFIPWDALLQTY